MISSVYWKLHPSSYNKEKTAINNTAAGKGNSIDEKVILVLID